MAASFARRLDHRLEALAPSAAPAPSATFCRHLAVRPARVVFHARSVEQRRKKLRPLSSAPAAMVRSYRGHPIGPAQNKRQMFRLFEEPSGREMYVELKVSRGFSNRDRVMVVAWLARIDGQWVSQHRVEPLGGVERR